MVTHNPWPTDYIGNIFDFKNGLNKGKEFFGFGIPIVNYVDVYSNDAIYKETVKGRVNLSVPEIRRYEVKKGDVFFTRTSETPDEVGIAAVLLDEIKNCVFSGFILRARQKKQVLLPEYCKYCFQTQQIRKAIVYNCTYTTRALTNGKQLSKIQIPIPPQNEQRFIAEALSETDHLIDITERIIAKKKAIKQGVIQDLFLKGTNTKESELGIIPENWDVLRIKDFFRLLPNNTFPRSVMNSECGTLQNIHYGDILTIYDAIIDCDKDCIPYFNPDVFIRDDLKLHSGDVIIADTAEDNTVGKAAEIINVGTKKVFAGLHTILLRSKNDRFVHGFLGLFFNTELFHAQLLPFVTGTKVSSISKESIKNLLVLCPPKNEQEEIVRIVCDSDKEISELEKYLVKLQGIKAGMMTELLTGKIRLQIEQPYNRAITNPGVNNE